MSTNTLTTFWISSSESEKFIKKRFFFLLIFWVFLFNIVARSALNSVYILFCHSGQETANCNFSLQSHQSEIEEIFHAKTWAIGVRTVCCHFIGGSFVLKVLKLFGSVVKLVPVIHHSWGDFPPLVGQLFGQWHECSSCGPYICCSVGVDRGICDFCVERFIV